MSTLYDLCLIALGVMVGNVFTLLPFFGLFALMERYYATVPEEREVPVRIVKKDCAKPGTQIHQALEDSARHRWEKAGEYDARQKWIRDGMYCYHVELLNREGKLLVGKIQKTPVRISAMHVDTWRRAIRTELVELAKRDGQKVPSHVRLKLISLRKVA